MLDTETCLTQDKHFNGSQTRYADTVSANISAAEISECKDLNFAASLTSFEANVWDGFLLFVNNLRLQKRKKIPKKLVVQHAREEMFLSITVILVLYFSKNLGNVSK